MKRFGLILVSIVFLSICTPAIIANADGGGSCYNIKLGNDYIPKSPDLLVATDSRYKISETKIEGVRALYESSSQINISWSRWKILDQAQDTLFYDSYILYRSADQGQTWQCSTISAARFFFDLSGLIKDTDYDFALTATDGFVWAPPTYFSASTNLLKRPVLQMCIPESFKPSVAAVVGKTVFIGTNEPLGSDLLLRWTFSENNWKSFKNVSSRYGGNFARFEEAIYFELSKSAKQVEVKVTPRADKINQMFQSNAYSGYTSAGCKTLTFKVDLKRKTLLKK